MSEAYLPTVSYQQQTEYGRTNVTVRIGATADMVNETLRHFRHAQAILAAGGRECNSGVPKVREHPDDHAGSVQEPLVSVWGDALLKVNGTSVKIALNVCTEYVTAWHLVELAWLLYDTVIAPNLETQAQSEASEQPAQPFTNRTQISGKAPEVPDADSEFMKLGRKAPAQSNGDAAAHFKLWSSKNNADYRQYEGQIISFDVAKIRRAASEQGVGLYRFFNTANSQFPAAGLQIYTDNDVAIQQVGEFLKALNLQPGQEISGKWLYYGRVKSKDEKTYINVTSIEQAF